MNNTKLSLKNLSGKRINFLIGSGMSYPFIKTLTMEDGQSWEDKYQKAEIENNEEEKNTLNNEFNNNILGQAKSVLDQEDGKDNFNITFDNYMEFLEKCYKFLSYQHTSYDSRINVFTTNYDPFFEIAMEKLSKKYNNDFILNDGGSGSLSRTLMMENFDRKIFKNGIVNTFNIQIKELKLFKIHGSITWEKQGNETLIKYNDISDEKVQIIKPTKNKFEDTLLQERYFHMIRTLTYELEKEQSVLIVFGFSFADEHIREIIKRSIHNPQLQVFVCVYEASEYDEWTKETNDNHFLCNNKIEILKKKNTNYDFKKFIEDLFNEK